MGANKTTPALRGPPHTPRGGSFIVSLFLFVCSWCLYSEKIALKSPSPLQKKTPNIPTVLLESCTFFCSFFFEPKLSVCSQPKDFLNYCNRTMSAAPLAGIRYIHSGGASLLALCPKARRPETEMESAGTKGKKKPTFCFTAHRKA